MLPKNGRSGTSMRSEKCPIIRSRSSGTILIREYGKSSGRNPRARAESVVSVRNGEPDLFDPHLQRVTGCGSFDIHGPGENVSARPFVGHLVVDSAQRRFNLAGWTPAASRRAGLLVMQRLHLNRIAGAHTQRGRGVAE